MSVADIRTTINGRVATLLLLQAKDEHAAVSMTLALLRYDLDDLETATRAEGEAEGKRKAEAACDVILAQAGCGHA